MRIGVAFTDELKRHQDDITLLVHVAGQQLPGDGYLDECRAFVSSTGHRLVTAPFTHNGALTMAFLRTTSEQFQQACYPEPGRPAGDRINIFETEFGVMALCVGADIFQPQYARLATLDGCRLLVASLWPRTFDVSGISMPADDRRLLLPGPWGSSQANCLPVALAGPSGGQLILPLSMTHDSSGLGRCSYDTDELRAAYESFPVFDSLSPGLYRKELLA